MNYGTVAHAVFVRESALENVSDDLHVAVRMHGESAAGCDDIFIDDAQRTKAHPLRIAILVEGKRVTRVEPAVIAAAALVTGTNLEHRNLNSEGRSQNAEVTFQIGDFR